MSISKFKWTYFAIFQTFFPSPYKCFLFFIVFTKHGNIALYCVVDIRQVKVHW